MKLALIMLLSLSSAYAASTRIPPLAAERQADGSKSDVELTRKIREQLVKNDSLSVYAENITIVTLSKKVTLQGEVESKAEGEKIANIARSLAGSNNVTNQLIYRK